MLVTHAMSYPASCNPSDRPSQNSSDGKRIGGDPSYNFPVQCSKFFFSPNTDTFASSTKTQCLGFDTLGERWCPPGRRHDHIQPTQSALGVSWSPPWPYLRIMASTFFSLILKTKHECFHTSRAIVFLFKRQREAIDPMEPGGEWKWSTSNHQICSSTTSQWHLPSHAENVQGKQIGGQKSQSCQTSRATIEKMMWRVENKVGFVMRSLRWWGG